ncbi:MAG: glycosyltransferase [Acidimicrobiia bacterium]|nr:glycosyltransferase [Acidimicrobiia bacterium]
MGVGKREPKAYSSSRFTRTGGKVTTHTEERAPRRRILLTLPELAVGGGPVIALNAIRYLDRARFEPHVLALYPDRTDMVDAFRAEGIDPVVLEHTPGRSIFESPRVARLIRERGIDLLHISGADERRISLYGAFLARVPAVVHIHSEWVHLGARVQPGSPPHVRLRRLALSRFRDEIEHHVACEYLADSPTAAALFEPSVRHPVHVMTQSMAFDAMAEAAAAHDDEAWRAELGLGPGPVAINISRHVPGKGQGRVIRAFAAVRRVVRDAQLVLVGDGEQFAENQRLSAELDVAGAVRFVGLRTDVAHLLAGADVFAFGSTTESFGLVVAEAMAARVAVVAYSLPSITSYAEDGVAALLPAQDDEAGYVDAFTRLMADAALRRRVADGGYRAVADRFPPDAAARSFEAAYDRALGHRAPGAGSRPAAAYRRVAAMASPRRAEDAVRPHR